ncbi:hypothetical protein OH76DRAFT_1556944 [Lentinus brumalis]|uniref:Uncharacterized protein n=1 Tax=Lentinus brumalis TaxID=2498619 RepID=A0A371D809_9APHY|nr:hypothetical protein OH76DRAFT_1556944 [Polyporus brumalis]
MPTAEGQGHANTAAPEPPSAAALAPGQVCYVYESITTPIELIFLSTPAIQANPTLVQQCQDALDRIHAENSTIGKVRPCIVMDLAPDGLRSPRICLKATFGGADPETLGEVYQHFIRGIFPNVGLPGFPHLHLVPEGREKNSWVVAFEFESLRPVSQTWEAALNGNPQASARTRKRKTFRSGSGVCRKLERASKAILRDECQKALHEWQAGCRQQPERALKRFEEYRNKPTLASMTTLNSSMSSLMYAPSTVTIPMDTLQEEVVAEAKDNMVLTSSGFPQDPCNICAVQKRKAPKTRKKSSRFSLRSARSFSKVHLKATP